MGEVICPSGHHLRSLGWGKVMLNLWEPQGVRNQTQLVLQDVVSIELPGKPGTPHEQIPLGKGNWAFLLSSNTIPQVSNLRMRFCSSPVPMAPSGCNIRNKPTLGSTTKRPVLTLQTFSFVVEGRTKRQRRLCPQQDSPKKKHNLVFLLHSRH